MSETRVREALARAAVGCASALDVGCGPVGEDGRTKYELNVPTRVGLDPRIEDGASGTRMFLRGVAPEALARFDDAGFDLVYALDVVEHLERAASEQAIREMQRIARRRVVVFTPNGFRANLQSGVRWMEHLCGWTAAELAALGFAVATWDFAYSFEQENDPAPEAALWAVWERPDAR